MLPGELDEKLSPQALSAAALYVLPVSKRLLVKSMASIGEGGLLVMTQEGQKSRLAPPGAMAKKYHEGWSHATKRNDTFITPRVHDGSPTQR